MYCGTKQSHGPLPSQLRFFQAIDDLVKIEHELSTIADEQASSAFKSYKLHDQYGI
jgi:hypothetical protein